ncbi:hypothetical protein AIOL_001944 [Candidatus Rhodobacter oscarellae]|uniref:Uncharacterized protein n=1 Tax=Candidatus Rhodobacter oscarellae TaxID=1675527 RepID=A0A0J9E299_9RHOB|nr:hypothetical protein [Candidatus Rhodobacter lobularis]KMW56986.1 hypothetical protein AIOL_001944 [Candidatus Rhodobacter lobularis]
MALQTTTLQGILRGPDGVALSGATLRFVLSHTAADVGSNTALVRTPVDVVSGNDGSVAVDLWPNANGFENTHYDVRAYANDENGKAVTYEFGKLQVPEVGPADLAELLGAGVLRAQGVEGQVLDAAVRAEMAAQSARASANEIDVGSLEGRLEDRVDAFADGARAEYPAVNLLRNARALDTDSNGGFVSPLGIYVPNDSEAVVTQRVLAPDHADIPAEIAGFTQNAGTPKYSFNVIEITGSKGASGSGRATLLPNRPVRGVHSSGFIAAQVSASGISVNYHDLDAGMVHEDVVWSETRFAHIDAFRIVFTGNNQKIWVVGPWVSAGKVSRSPLFLMHDTYFLNQT